MLYKNLPARLLEHTMRWRFVFDYAAALQLFITGKPKNAISVFRARRDYKNMQPSFAEKRKQNILYATSDNKSDIFQKSIIHSVNIRSCCTSGNLPGKSMLSGHIQDMVVP